MRNNKSITATALTVVAASAKPKPTRLERFRSVVGKVSAMATGMMLSASAFAQATDLPADLTGADAFMRAKGLIAIGVASVITLIVLGIRGAKLPRSGS